MIEAATIHFRTISIQLLVESPHLVRIRLRATPQDEGNHRTIQPVPDATFCDWSNTESQRRRSVFGQGASFNPNLVSVPSPVRSVSPVTGYVRNSRMRFALDQTTMTTLSLLSRSIRPPDSRFREEPER